MLHCSVRDLYKIQYVLLWMLLSLKAGYLNAAGFLATGNFVSHVTGFGTQMGISIAHEDYLFGAELLIIPLAFILGSSVPAWVLDWNYSERRLPKYHYVQFLITIGLGIVFYLGINGFFGSFGDAKNDVNDIILVGLLCFICGMKNGLTTWATSGKIRTTHLTGLSTDIGLNIPKLFKKNPRSKFPEPKQRNTMRILTFISFSAGSLIAAFTFPAMSYLGFLFPFLLSLFLSAVSYLNHRYHSSKVDHVSKEHLCQF